MCTSKYDSGVKACLPADELALAPSDQVGSATASITKEVGTAGGCAGCMFPTIFKPLRFILGSKPAHAPPVNENSRIRTAKHSETLVLKHEEAASMRGRRLSPALEQVHLSAP